MEQANKAHIKICGLTDPELAYQTACAGADYIGLIFHKPSKRCVELQQAVEIAEAAKRGNAMPVAVFVNDKADAIQHICDEAEITHIQCHGIGARLAQSSLPRHFQRIVVCHIDQYGIFVNKGDISDLQADRDFILFDGVEGGSGTPIPLGNINTVANFPFFVAGGLNIDSVKEVVSQYRPYAVDVSTGVEDSTGTKSLTLIKQFINAVNEV